MKSISRWPHAIVTAALISGLFSAPLQAAEKVKEGETVIPVMFVQNAAASSYADGVLTLKNIHPELLWFSDRPYRMAGTTTLDAYMADWQDSIDSFKLDPPNATLSYLNGDYMSSVALELTDPKVNGDSISYQVKTLQGELPASSGPLSLFIDFVGMVWHRPVVVRRPFVVRRPVVVTRPFVVKPAPVVVVNKPATAVVVDPDPMMATTATTVEVKKSPAVVDVHVQNNSKTEEKLRQLKGMYEQGLITRSEYKQKQEQLLKQF